MEDETWKALGRGSALGRALHSIYGGSSMGKRSPSAR